MDVVATENFRSVDQLLGAPAHAAADSIQRLGGRDQARVFLRYQVSEQNRWYFDTWERAQIGLGIVLILVLLFGTAPDRMLLSLTLAMLGIVLLMHFFLTPEIVRLGRAIDFAPPGTPSGDRTRFWAFHGAYSASELVKLAAGLAAALLLVRRTRRAQPAEADRVHESDQSHVER